MIVWDAEFDTPSPQIAELVEGAYRQTLESLGRLLQHAPTNH